MTSILGTQSIQHPNGTSAMTVAADGLVSFGNVKSGNTPCFLAIFSSPLNSQSNNVAVKVPFNPALVLLELLIDVNKFSFKFELPAVVDAL